jgi:NAD(P)-dependent dehydrogenase (short-subunit alcohol dehydrogenase family)
MGDKKITVNCVAPGGIKTDMYQKVCREYIPNGDKLNDDQVDEVRKTSHPNLLATEILTPKSVCRHMVATSPCRSSNRCRSCCVLPCKPRRRVDQRKGLGY